jgi:hypothetical protein
VLGEGAWETGASTLCATASGLAASWAAVLFKGMHKAKGIKLNANRRSNFHDKNMSSP